VPVEEEEEEEEEEGEEEEEEEVCNLSKRSLLCYHILSTEWCTTFFH
jgi:hypothetical protein